jgi:TRAP-type C4-dicarboxylate transport system permease small subunit
MKWLDRVSDTGVILAIVALVFMMVHVSLDIICKKIGLGPITGTLEIVSIYYMIGCIFLPMMFVQRLRAHIFVELLTERFSPKTVRVIDLFASIITLAFALGLAYMGAAEALDQTMIRAKSEAATIAIEVWPSRWFVVFGTGGMTLYLLLQVGQQFRELIRPAKVDKSPASAEDILDAGQSIDKKNSAGEKRK